MKKVWPYFFRFFVYGVFPFCAWLAGYQWTETYFRERLVPYPFERFGIAVGMTGFFWTLALVIIIRMFVKKRRKLP